MAEANFSTFHYLLFTFFYNFAPDKTKNFIFFKLMRVIIESDYQKMSQWAAEHVIDRINAFKPTAEKPFVLGLPTGSSPEGMYACLVKANKEGRVSFKNVLTFNMDVM